MRRFVRGIFGLGASAVGIHYALAWYKPDLCCWYVDRILCGKFFEEELYRKLIFMGFAMKNKAVPRESSIEGLIDECGKKYSKELFNRRFRIPFGLSAGIDLHSECIENLSALGFEFIETGLSQDDMEILNPRDPNHGKCSITKHEEGLLYLNDPKYRVITLNNLNIQNYHLSLLKNTNKPKHSENFLGLSFRVSEKTLTSVPYLLDNAFIGSFQKSYSIADFITADLSSNKSIVIKPYLYADKIKDVLKTLESIVYKEIGISSAFEYESIQVRQSKNESLDNELISNFMQPRMHLIRKDRSFFFIRLDIEKVETIQKNNLTEYLKALEQSEIVDGIILDSSIHRDRRTYKNSLENKEKLKRDLIKVRSIIKENTRLKVITDDAVSKGSDIVEYYKLGADFVLVNSIFLLEGPKCIERLLKELISINKI